MDSDENREQRILRQIIGTERYRQKCLADYVRAGGVVFDRIVTPRPEGTDHETNP